MKLISSVSDERRRWFGLVVVCMAQLMIVLDSTIVNVALPSIQRDLGFSSGNLTWVVNAFLLTLGSFMLVAGRLSDLVGRKRLFETGLVVFTAASVLCGLAPDQAFLIGARFIQGVGAAMQASVILAIIVTEFPDPVDRAKAMSAYVFTAVAGGSLGLLLGGILTQALSWHWIFFVNLPIGAATLTAGRVLIPRDHGIGIGEGLDWLGSALVTVSLMTAVYAIVQATNHGWGSAQVLGPGAVAVALMAAFLTVEARVANPIMPLGILRLRGLMAGAAARGFLVTGMFSTFFLGTIYLEHILHYSAIQAGLSFLPWTLTVAALSLGINRRLVARFGPMRVMIGGMTSVIAGLTLLTSIGTATAFFPTLFFAFFLIGFGIGNTFTPLMTISMADVPVNEAGLGSAITNLSMQVGGAFGIAVLSTIATNHTKALVAHHVGLAGALVRGDHLAFTVAIGSVAVAIAIAALLLRPPRAQVVVAPAAALPAAPAPVPAPVPATVSVRVARPAAAIAQAPVLRRIIVPVRANSHVYELPHEYDETA
jgi:EmrB/QacA subfamily drug resistance transporter